MKLKNFEIENNYIFRLEFENGESKVVDLKPLIESKVSPNELISARIDKDWGCLEFKDALVDIEPQTLYKFCKSNTNNNQHTRSLKQ